MKITWVYPFKNAIIYVLAGLMMLTVLLATIDLGWALIKDILAPPRFLLGIDDLLDIFGLFLLVLLGLELLDTILAYLKEDIIHIEVVLVVALIAVSRKVIILDLAKLSPLTLFGVGWILLTLGIGYYLIKRLHAQAR